MAQVTKNIISPVHVNENGDTFISVDGKAFLVSSDKITETHITSAPGEFRNLVLALEHFTVTNEGLTWYHGVSRFKYIKESNKFYINNSEVLAESFEKHLMATGLVRYDLKSKIQLFEYAAKNYDSFASLEFVEKIEEGHIKCYVMKLNESFFVYRMNEANKIYKFDELNAAECFDYVKEQTGHELVMASELLEGERAKAAEKSEKIKVLEQMVAFLKDQRGVIAEADKSIDEIKEADTLINSEIKRIEEEIENLRNDIEETEEAHDEEDEMDEAESDATDSDTMEDGEEAGEPAEEIESDAEEVDSDEEREAEGEEATDEAPEAEGEEGKDDVAGEEEETETPEDESTGDQDDEVEDEGDSDIDDEDDDDDDEDEIEESDDISEDEAEKIEDEENSEAEVEKAEEDQDGLEASYDEAEEAEEDEEMNEWAVRGMDANYDNGVPDELRDKARKMGVRITYDPEGGEYAGSLSLSSKNKKAILQIAAITGHLDDIKDGMYELEESKIAEKKTNEAELEENEIDRADGYVPGTLRFKVAEFAEGTELKVDAEGYTTAGSDDSVNVFINEQPKKVLKREIALADSETI